MPVNAWAPLLGAALLASAWSGPLPGLARGSFAAHMGLHLLVVAAAAPLLALAVLQQRGPRSRALRLVSPLPASLVELVVVGAWHLPWLHHAARTAFAPFVLEQAMFLAAGLLFWLSIVGAVNDDQGRTAGTAVVALALTLAHMTLLGALLALGPRPLYAHDGGAVEALADQQRGGALMLVVSAVVYVTAGVLTGQRLLRPLAPIRVGRP
jgi:putative membrane protein